METKDRELLIKVMEIILTHLKECKIFKYGLCDLVYQLKWSPNRISCEGKSIFDEYLRIHEPPTLVDQYYYWKPGLKEPRIEWLEKHLEILKRI